MKLDRLHTLNTLCLTMGEFLGDLDCLETLELKDFNKNETLLVMIDMINGFCKFGPLSSDYVGAIIPDMAKILDSAISLGIPVVSYRDAHPADATEFGSFPPHCVAGSEESELVDELHRDALIDVPKNSTNGFLAQNPLDFVDAKAIRHILVMGCVTDICVRDFTATMNKYLQEINQPCQVYLIENLVETYHIEGTHDRQVEHTLALYQLHTSGIRLIHL